MYVLASHWKGRRKKKSEENNPNGLEFSTDGTKMYMVGSTGNDNNEYTLSTAFDISTASFVHSFNFVAPSSEEGGMDMTFNYDGTKKNCLQ